MLKRAINEYPNISLDPDKLGDKVDFQLIFGRLGPVHIEIGSGKGSFLLSQANHFPYINFLGIEWARKYYRYCVDRFGRRGIDNVRMIRADAAVFVSHLIPDSSISCFHIYYPDPWPKKRHHKRRILSDQNMPLLYKCLTVTGSIRFVTDDAKYFESFENYVKTNDRFWEKRDFIPLPGTPDGEFVGTNYERKYRNEGRSVYAIEVRKRSPLNVHIPLTEKDLMNPLTQSTDTFYHRY